MITFKEFADFEWFSFTVGIYDVHIFFEQSAGGVLLEGKSKWVSLGGEYSARLDKSHSLVGQNHIHVYAKNNQLFSMNLDGSAHDQSHGTKIPSRVAAAIIQKFPTFTIPSNNFIERAPDEILSIGRSLLLG
jgi:hypothetical protein